MIDDKLKEILEDWYPGTQYSEVIPKIKQAFADEGYVYGGDSSLQGQNETIAEYHKRLKALEKPQETKQ